LHRIGWQESPEYAGEEQRAGRPAGGGGVDAALEGVRALSWGG
jgi:hypothetical protein